LDGSSAKNKQKKYKNHPLCHFRQKYVPNLEKIEEEEGEIVREEVSSDSAISSSPRSVQETVDPFETTSPKFRARKTVSYTLPSIRS
jgi:hypothetical protein